MQIAASLTFLTILWWGWHNSFSLSVFFIEFITAAIFAGHSHQWPDLLLHSGLLMWAISDLRRRNVWAWPFEMWSIALYLLALLHHLESWWVAPCWLGVFLLFGWATGGFGSADAWLIASLSTVLSLMMLLQVVLLACLTTMGHAALHREATYPFLFHLQLAYGLALLFF